MQKQTRSISPFPGIQHFLLWTRHTTAIVAELVRICNGFSKTPKIPEIRNSIWNEVFEFLNKDEADSTSTHKHTHTHSHNMRLISSGTWFDADIIEKVKGGHMLLGFDLQNATRGDYDHVTSLLNDVLGNARTPCSTVLPKNLSNISPHFMQLHCSLPSSQEPAKCPTVN